MKNAFTTLLATMWLVIPGIQYLGAVARTSAVVERRAPSPLARLDLTPWYAALLIATVAVAGMGRARSSRESKISPS